MTERAEDLTSQETSTSQLPSGQTIRVIGGRRYKATDLGAKDLTGAFEAARHISRSSSLITRKNTTPLQTRIEKDQLASRR